MNLIVAKFIYSLRSGEGREFYFGNTFGYRNDK